MNRDALKIQIIDKQQRVWSKTGRWYVCPNCEQVFNQGGHLHEAFIPRGRGIPDEVVMNEINCTVLCMQCHIPDGPTRTVKLNILRFKLSLGLDVHAWLKKMDRDYTILMPDIF